jgi:hypothetical protein
MSKFSTIFVITATTLIITASSGSAQTTTAKTYAERVHSVAALKEHIANREARFEVLRQDLLALDARTEKQIDQIVTTLASMRDSESSKTRIANVKTEIMDALVRTMMAYRQKRTDLYERMRREKTVPQEELEKTLTAFDTRIGKRLEQVMQLAKSFPGHVDVEKYESYGSSYYNGWHYENTRISEEWRQNRRNTTASRTARQEIVKKIEKAIETNQSRRATVAENLSGRRLSEQDRAVQAEELGRLDATIDNLKAQLRELALPAAAGTREISASEAHDATMLLDDTRADLARDFSDIMRKYNDLEAERTRIFALKANLKAREEWLSKTPAPQN